MSPVTTPRKWTVHLIVYLLEPPLLRFGSAGAVFLRCFLKVLRKLVVIAFTNVTTTVSSAFMIKTSKTSIEIHLLSPLDKKEKRLDERPLTLT